MRWPLLWQHVFNVLFRPEAFLWVQVFNVHMPFNKMKSCCHKRHDGDLVATGEGEMESREKSRPQFLVAVLLAERDRACCSHRPTVQHSGRGLVSVHVDGQPVSSKRLAFVMQPERIVTPQMPADFDRFRDDTMAQQPAQTRNLSQPNDWNLP